MSRLKKFEVKKGNLFYRREIEFDNKLKEIIWKISMKIKGANIKDISSEMKNN